MAKQVLIRVVRSDGDSMEFGTGTDWAIESDGLENFANLSYELSSSENVTYDGATVTGKRVASIDRTVSATLKDATQNEVMRERLIRFFSPRFSYECHVTYQGRTLWCQGEQYGFRCDNGNVYRPVSFTWTMLCPMPYMLSEDDFGQDIANIEPRFGFPLQSCPPAGTESVVWPESDQPSRVCTIDMPREGKLHSLDVYGATKQNLWVNPSGTNSGVTVTSNDDGSMTIDGAATGVINISVTNIRTLVPGKSYTVQSDSALSSSVQGSFSIIQRDSSNANVGVNKHFGYGSSLSNTFTVDDGVAYVIFQVYCNPSAGGSLTPGTYRVMLNEGETAETWCPPGINGVEPTAIVVSQTENAEDGTSTPIDMQGHTLYSLPDGTRDELRIDDDGKVTKVAESEDITFDGSDDEDWSIDVQSSYTRFYYNLQNQAQPSDLTGGVTSLCSSLTILPKGGTAASGVTGYTVTSGAIFVSIDGIDTIEALKTWLKSNSTTLVYKPAEPKSVYLGTIDLPELPASSANVWAVSDIPADVYASASAGTQPSGYQVGFIWSSYSFARTVEIPNDGDVDTYCRAVMIANGEVTNPQLIKGKKYVRILDTLQEGDVVEIDFTQRPPTVTKNGENIINKTDRLSSFVGMELPVGVNTIQYDADNGSNALSVAIYYNKRYLGI